MKLEKQLEEQLTKLKPTAPPAPSQPVGRPPAPPAPPAPPPPPLPPPNMKAMSLRDSVAIGKNSAKKKTNRATTGPASPDMAALMKEAQAKRLKKKLGTGSSKPTKEPGTEEENTSEYGPPWDKVPPQDLSLFERQVWKAKQLDLKEKAGVSDTVGEEESPAKAKEEAEAAAAAEAARVKAEEEEARRKKAEEAKKLLKKDDKVKLIASSDEHGVVIKREGPRVRVDFSESGGKKSRWVKATELVKQGGGGRKYKRRKTNRRKTNRRKTKRRKTKRRKTNRRKLSKRRKKTKRRKLSRRRR
jgi:hypothetical protein